MGPSIAGLLVMAVFFTGLMMMSRTILAGEVVVSRAMTDAAWYSSKRVNTDLRITNVNLTPGSECNLTIAVENRGTTSIVDFRHMDVIVQFFGGNNISQRLVYNSSGSPSISGEWGRSFPSGSNLHEPGIFNPGETMTVTGKLTLLAGDYSGSDIYLGEDETANLSANETTLPVTDASVFVQGQDVMIEDEKLNITSIFGDELTVTRGEGSTDPNVHANGIGIWTLDDAVVVVGSPNGVAAAATLADLVVPCP